jgi:hypothetical protein
VQEDDRRPLRIPLLHRQSHAGMVDHALSHRSVLTPSPVCATAGWLDVYGSFAPDTPPLPSIAWKSLSMTST